MIREPHFHQFALAELLPFFEQFPTQYLSGERNIKLAYRHLVQPESAVRKLMILVNGRAENMLKWTELAYDFYQQGYDVLLEVQAWILHEGKVRSIFQDFCYLQSFPFPLVG